MLRRAYERTGGFRWGLAALLLGLPLPIIILAFLSPGCRWFWRGKHLSVSSCRGPVGAL